MGGWKGPPDARKMITECRHNYLDRRLRETQAADEQVNA